jgi:hypothetical protein
MHAAFVFPHKRTHGWKCLSLVLDCRWCCCQIVDVVACVRFSLLLPILLSSGVVGSFVVDAIVCFFGLFVILLLISLSSRNSFC